MNDDAVDMRDWPKSMVELAEIIGPGAALRFVDAFAGRDYVSIPKRLHDTHPLIQAIGVTAANLLVEAAMGDRFLVPVMHDQRRLAKKRMILRADGTPGEIARRFGVTARWVRKVKNEPREDDRQLNLFE